MRRISTIVTALELDQTQARTALIIAVALVMAVVIYFAPAEQVHSLVYGNPLDALGVLVYLLVGAALAGVLAGLIERKPPTLAVSTAAALAFATVEPRIAAIKTSALRFGRAALTAARRAAQALSAATPPISLLPLYTPHRPLLKGWAPGTHPAIIYEQTSPGLGRG